MKLFISGRNEIEVVKLHKLLSAIENFDFNDPNPPIIFRDDFLVAMLELDSRMVRNNNIDSLVAEERTLSFQKLNCKLEKTLATMKSLRLRHLTNDHFYSTVCLSNDHLRRELIRLLKKRLRAMERPTILSYRNILRTTTNFIFSFLGKTKLRPTRDGKTDSNVFKRLKDQYFKNLRSYYEYYRSKEIQQSYSLT